MDKIEKICKFKFRYKKNQKYFFYKKNIIQYFKYKNYR